jgi:hypothetical protein
MKKKMGAWNTNGVENLQMPSDDSIAKVIRNAVFHVKRVSVREHIKADRIERVNLFLTSLRNGLNIFRQNFSFFMLCDSLLRKDMWYEPGILNGTDLLGSPLLLPRTQVVKWVDMARKNYGDDTTVAFINHDLEVLDQIVGGCIANCDVAKRINEESEIISSDLCNLFA